ncbi:MAG: hypothetical protein AAFX85_04435 [Pseudomonadota bacterium]
MTTWHLTSVVSLLLCLGGCVSVPRTLPDGTTERLRGAQIREYAAEVFRRHNAVSSQLLEALPYLEAQDLALADALLEHETRMNEACRPIDSVAIRYRDGDAVDLGDKLTFARALSACESATEELERALAPVLELS